MKKYGDLKLSKLRDALELDFAHYTYLRGQCSCCYGPLDMPVRYWRKGRKPQKVVTAVATETRGGAFHYELDGERFDIENIKYILFKNANNGCGIKKRTDDIKKDYVSWKFPIEMLIPVCKALKAQLGDEYNVYVPESESFCIRILHRSFLDRATEKELEYNGYKLLEDDERGNKEGT
ncbi:MAG: hypothetical protein IKA41_01645 [Bacteroidaceae bacterium]|nr:hypothetical protein [Bacteroidaceae bacterium]